MSTYEVGTAPNNVIFELEDAQPPAPAGTIVNIRSDNDAVIVLIGRGGISFSTTPISLTLAQGIADAIYAQIGNPG